MRKSKATKRSLTASIVTLVVCVAMLIGTTFAWFTDTASTSVNKIQAGTLKVALVDQAGNPLTESLKWQKAAGHEAEAILWEPGATYNLQSFKVVNKGNLALKYKIQIAGVEQGNAKLLDALDFTYTEGDANLDLTAEHHLAAEAESGLITISAKMRETAGNEYQGESVDGIAITVIATQDTVEFDSNGNTYDADAIYPVAVAGEVNTSGDTVLQDNQTDYNVKLTVPSGAVDEEVTSLTLTVENAVTPANVQIEDAATIHTFEVTLKDQSGNKVTATGANLFTVEMNIGPNRTMLKMYHSGTLMTKDKNGLIEAADHYVYDSATGLVTMKVNSFSPFSAVYNKDVWTAHIAEDYATPISNNTVTIASAEELALFAKQVTDDGINYSKYTVNITENIDLGKYLWKPIKGNGKMSDITFDGNGHTISNMIIRGSTNTSNPPYGTGFIGDTNGSITIKNLNFSDADVWFVDYASKQYAGNIGGIIMGYTYGTTVFENVSVTNSEIWGYGKIGILLGMGADPGVKVTFSNCTSKDNSLHGATNMGGLAGMIMRGNGVDYTTVENCTVENIDVTYYPNGSYVDISNAEATFKSDDTEDGTDVKKFVTGKYLNRDQCYWGGYGDYYISYGHRSYDAPVEGYDQCLANSEYPVNKQ